MSSKGHTYGVNGTTPSLELLWLRMLLCDVHGPGSVSSRSLWGVWVWEEERAALALPGPGLATAEVKKRGAEVGSWRRLRGGRG